MDKLKDKEIMLIHVFLRVLNTAVGVKEQKAIKE